MRLILLAECYGRVTLWQVAKWLAALDDTDMRDKDVVIMRLLGMTSILWFCVCFSPARADDSQSCFMCALSYCSPVLAPQGISSGTQ